MARNHSEGTPTLLTGWTSLQSQGALKSLLQHHSVGEVQKQFKSSIQTLMCKIKYPLSVKQILFGKETLSYRINDATD